MTDPDERTINRAIAEVYVNATKSAEELQDIREAARGALHRLFRDRRRLEAELTELREAVRAYKHYSDSPGSVIHSWNDHDDLDAIGGKCGLCQLIEANAAEEADLWHPRSMQRLLRDTRADTDPRSDSKRAGIQASMRASAGEVTPLTDPAYSIVVKRRPKTSLASPGELERLIRALSLDALAIIPMYRRLHSMGNEAEVGESVYVSGGGVSDPTADLAVDSDYAEGRREYARWVASEVFEAARRLDRIRQGLERNVGPTPGYRQSVMVGSDAIVSMEELTESLENQKQRLRQGAE